MYGYYGQSLYLRFPIASVINMLSVLGWLLQTRHAAVNTHAATGRRRACVGYWHLYYHM